MRQRTTDSEHSPQVTDAVFRLATVSPKWWAGEQVRVLDLSP